MPLRRLRWPFLLLLGWVATTAAHAAAPQSPSATAPTLASYFDTTGRTDTLGGGVRLIPIKTPGGTFRVWTKRVGNNPRIKVLLLHGGPGMTHEYFEAFDSWFPREGVEYYYYDQLGSAYSDQPKDPALWDLSRFVEEVEQVRVALGLDEKNFYLLGHSWGGLLAIEYALKYPQHLKGLVISNMMASVPEYVAYAQNVLMPQLEAPVLKELLELEARKDYDNPRYLELLVPNYYEHHLLRMPASEWPDPVNRSFNKVNRDVYVPMQGPSEMSSSGKLEKWDRYADLARIATPTLVIGARYDTMDPKHMERMAQRLPHGRFLYVANGAHMAMYDDPATYFGGLLKFLHDVDRHAAR